MAGGQFDSLLLSLASLIIIFLLAPNFVEEKIAREDIKHNQSRSLATQNLFRKNNFHFEKPDKRGRERRRETETEIKGSVLK